MSKNINREKAEIEKSLDRVIEEYNSTACLVVDLATRIALHDGKMLEQ